MVMVVVLVELNCVILSVQREKIELNCFVTWSLQGTTRPTHYHVLLDEVGFSADELQELVHSLSYV